MLIVWGFGGDLGVVLGWFLGLVLCVGFWFFFFSRTVSIIQEFE